MTDHELIAAIEHSVYGIRGRDLERRLEENPKKCQNQCWRTRGVAPEYLFPGSSMVEWAAVNRLVVGSSPTRGATKFTSMFP
jgi:hypothetical protein